MTKVSDVAFALLAVWYIQTASEAHCRLVDRSFGQRGPTVAAQIYCCIAAPLDLMLFDNLHRLLPRLPPLDRWATIGYQPAGGDR